MATPFVAQTKSAVRWRGGVQLGMSSLGYASRFGGGGYENAKDRPEFRGWSSTFGSADSDIIPDLETLRSRARDLDRNNGIAGGAVRTAVDSTVGVGLKLVSIPEYRLLGNDASWAEEWSRQVEALWRIYSSSVDFDASRRQAFSGMTRMVARSFMTNGEALALPLWIDRGNRFRTAFQVLEADRLSTPTAMLEGSTLRGGVEMDQYGAPIAYWIRKTHPGDTIQVGVSQSEWERVPAFTSWGRRRVIHVYDRQRPEQSRGVPAFASSLATFRMMERYQRAELQAAIVNAMVALVVESPMAPEQTAAMFGAAAGVDGVDAATAYAEKRKQYEITMQGGMILPLALGDKAYSHNPQRPATAFGAFIESLARQIGASVNMPYELILKDWSKTNYSSARAALLEAWRTFLSTRQLIADLWAQPVFELWLEEAVSSGEIEAPDFYVNIQLYARAKWIGPGRGWVDPVKEAQAAQMRMDAGLSTLEMEAAEQGLDWEELAEQRSRERSRLAELKDPAANFSADPAMTDAVNEADAKEQRQQEHAQ